MVTQHAIDEADIRRRIDKWTEAIRAMDLDSVMSIYALDVVSFDIDPPLQYAGAAAKRKRWAHVFGMHQRPLGYEVRDVAITSNEDLAFGHSLNRVTGTLKNGTKNDFWLRWTMCFRRIDRDWLIVHEQLSVPLDLNSGRALLNLEP